jgi:hypothetical protein
MLKCLTRLMGTVPDVCPPLVDKMTYPNPYGVSFWRQMLRGDEDTCIFINVTKR